MNELQVKEEVRRYLQDESYNYAVLIDGEWGCGKTFFVKNELSQAIKEQEKLGKNRDIKYISLYGCKSVSDIQENIFWALADGVKEGPNEDKDSDRSNIKVIRKLLQSGRKIGSAVFKKFNAEDLVYSFSSDWINLSPSIYIFDDLERCDCPMNEVFGFLNELVEHEDKKVILVANEAEISGTADPTNPEQQYFLALQDKIEWPKPKKSGFLNNYSNNSKTISLDELERRRGILFPKCDANTEYKKIREKLIGESLRYTPDIPKTMVKIIEATNVSEELRQLLMSYIPTFKEYMDNVQHHNLRTFQFFLSKASYLVERLNDIDYDKEYLAAIKEEVLIATFRNAVYLKSNYRPSTYNSEWLRAEQNSGSSVVKDYVECGKFVFEEYEQYVLTIQKEKQASISDDDPYYQIYQHYYIHTQKWCEEQLCKLLDKLKDNKYPISFYTKIIIAIQRLQNLGFDSCYLEDAKKYMKHNVSSMGEVHPIDDDLWFMDNTEFRTKVLESINEINSYISDHTWEAGSEHVTLLLSRDNWVKQLEKYTNPNDSRYVYDMPAFSKAESQVWLKRICEANPQEIDDFRKWLSNLYPRDVIRRSYQQDRETIKQIIEGLKSHKETDLIKKATLGWLEDQLEKVVATNESVVSNSESSISNSKEE